MITLSEAQILGWLTTWLLPVFRILGVMATAPILSSRNIPARAKIALAMVLAIAIAPFAPTPEGFSLASSAAWPAVVKEVIVGAALGFLVRLVMLTFEVAGELIGLQIGLSYAGYFTPGAASGNAVGALSGLIASWLFVTLNGPLLLIGCLVKSYERFPSGLTSQSNLAQASASTIDPMKIISLLTDIFGMALVLAIPVVTLLLLINFAMGVASKVAPQINLFAVGFPILMLCGL